MRTCPNCKTKNFDTSTKCEKCNRPLTSNPFETVIKIPPQNDSQESEPLFYVKRKSANGLQRVARAFMILSCTIYALATLVLFMLGIISLFFEDGDFVAIVFWIYAFVSFVPFIISACMTNNYSYKTENGIKVGIVFKIATFLIVDPVAGILMLCDASNDDNQ